MATLTKKQFMALTPAERSKLSRPQKKRARRPRNRQMGVNPSIPASKGSAGRSKRRQGRRKGNRRANNQVTTFGNTRSFKIPIDEDVGNMFGTTAFAVVVQTVGAQPIALNPGNPQLFPFASRIAQNYERYEFTKLRFEYRPSASEFATVGSQGLVGISATMDAAQAPPSSQPQVDVLFHGPIVETAHATHLDIPKSFLQSKSKREKFMVRQNGFIPGGASVHDYDCGLVFPWTSGQVNTAQIGTLRVIGEVLLSNPLLDTSSFPPVNNSVAVFQGQNIPAGTSGVVTFLTLPVVTQNPFGITQPLPYSYLLPAGNYNIDFWSDVDLSGSPTSGGVYSLLCYVNGTEISPFLSTSYPNSATAVGVQHLALSYGAFVQSNGTTTLAFATDISYVATTADIDAFLRITAV